MREIEKAWKALKLAYVCHEAARKQFRAGIITADEYCTVHHEFDNAFARWHQAEIALQLKPHPRAGADSPAHPNTRNPER